MSETTPILIGATAQSSRVSLNPRMANRHGLITGATGTGKTVTLQVLAEGFSRMGVPVFTADVKGDLSGISKEGAPHEKVDERIQKIGIENYKAQGCPTMFWDVFGEKGQPVRTTISEMGPLLLSRLFDLNEVQESLMHVAFRLADDQGLLLLDIKDLRAMLTWMGDNAKEIRTRYGTVSTRSIGAIQRRLLVLEDAGGEMFFGEPALKLEHLMQHDFSGRGVISVLDATKLIHNPRIYSTFLLWLLAELFEQLDEVGDPEKPRLVFFFDEAHLLFKDISKPLLEKIEQVVRLVRSKGVGVYFVTQNPLDIPQDVLGQLGNRVQHALRAFTPKDRKVIRAVAENFRTNENIDTEKLITELGIGEALVSVLDDEGEPTPVEHLLIVPPESRIGPIEDAERSELMSRSPLKGVYEEAVDRESAYELLKKREEGAGEGVAVEKNKEPEKARKHSRQGAGEAFFKSLVRSIGSQVGRRIARGLLGSLAGSRR